MKPRTRTYEAWLLTLGAYNAQNNTRAITEPMPAIRCVVEPPCSVCWYCQKAKEKR